MHGRNYDIYFNELNIGAMAISGECESGKSELTGLTIWVEIQRPHHLDFDQLRTFLTMVGGAASDQSEACHGQYEYEINMTMLGSLWNAMRDRENVPPLQYAASGPAVWIWDENYKESATTSPSDQ